jgi:hypothetical protein
LLQAVLACLQGGCGEEVAVEVKLATNQLTLFVWIVSVACLVGWLLRQTGIMQSSQHGGLLSFLGNRYEKLTLTKTTSIKFSEIWAINLNFCKLRHGLGL